MVVDPVVVANFGPPPDGIDLSEIYPANADAVVISLACIATLAVCLRFTARWLQNARLEADDFLILFALCFAIATCILVIQAIAAGAGRHVWALASDEIAECSKWLFLLGVSCATSLGATKTSILWLYVRLFGLNNRIFKVLVYIGAVLSTVCALATIVMLAATCRPTSYFWDRYRPSEVPGSCQNTGEALYAIGLTNLAMDFYLVIIPIPIILGLNTSRRRRVVLCALILVGMFTCAAGVVRNYYLSMFTPSIEPDYTWGMQPANIWLSVEATLGIVCACLANLMPLHLWLRDRIRSIFDSRGTRELASSEGPKTSDKSTLKLPNYIESKLVLRPQKEDEIRLTTLATIVADRGSDDGARHIDGIVVRSELIQVIHDANQPSPPASRKGV